MPDERSEFDEFDAFVFTCATCGMPIEFLQRKDDHSQQFFRRPHYYCERPTVRLRTQNPRRLGVITGITE